VESTKRGQRGMALFVTILMLVFMTAIAFAAMDTVARDREVAGLQNRSRNAFYAAEAAVAEARSLIRNVGNRSEIPAFYDVNNPRLLADLTLYDREASQPRFYGDPDFAPPIRYVGESGGGIGGAEGFSLSVAGQRLASTLWQINVVGEAPGGSQARLEVAEVKVMAAGY
jgi:hypothetical protein